MLIFDKPLERRMPDHPIIGNFRIRNLGIEAGLDPFGICLVERLHQGAVGPYKGLQRTPNFPSGLAVPSGPHAAHIDQCAALLAREP
jgi:hypothetical protein